MTRTTRQTKADNSVSEELSPMQEKQKMLKDAMRSMRDITYNTENPLEIPVELQERMAAEGYRLRWIRAMINGQTRS